jgi:hypothetical protein
MARDLSDAFSEAIRADPPVESPEVELHGFDHLFVDRLYPEE